MARVRAAARRPRARVANCSVKTAFALYASFAIIVAIILSVIVTTAFGFMAESTLSDDPFAHSGTFVYDDATNSLVPAEALSWYEVAAFDDLAAQGVETAAEGNRLKQVVQLYVESAASRDKEPIDLDDPPHDIEDGTVVDVCWTTSVSEVYEEHLRFAEIASYNAAEAPTRPGFETAEALSMELPANANGARPVVSTVGYYIPYPGDPAPYRTIANIAIASVPTIFVVCLIAAGRIFYNNRIARPVAAMEGAAAKIAEDDLDFTVEAQRDDELGRLCARFEDMRAELARSKNELWRAAESRRRVNAAFAHDLRTPLTVVRGRAEYIEMLADDKVRDAASVIRRQAERLADFADSMSGLDSLEGAPLHTADIRPSDVLAKIEEGAAGFAEAAGIALTVRAGELPDSVRADEAILLRVADNLVSNAVRHATSAVSVELDGTGEDLSLTVSDDGPGFGDAAARALEPFWRGADERSESPGGSGGHLGLGLYICSVLCAKHGGSISISDGPDGGGVVRAHFAASS